MARDKESRREAKEARDGKDDYEFIPADFDEDAFIHREMVSFRTTTVLFLWGIVAALVSWALFAAVQGDDTGWLLGLVVATVFGFALKWIFPLVKADIKHFGRKEWLGTAFLFFFTWLSFFILAVNPPVSDFAAPRVEVIPAPTVQQVDGTVVLEAFFEDNLRVAEHGLTLTGPDGEVPLQDEDLGRGHHRYVARDLPAGIYLAEATATDTRGHTNTANATFTVVEKTLDVFLPDAAILDSPADAVVVQTPGVEACDATGKPKRIRNAPCVRTVHLDLQGGGQVLLEFDESANGWLGRSNHAGWRSGPVSFNVTAEMVGQYAGSIFVPGGAQTSGPHNITVSAPLGDYMPKVLKEPAEPTRSVPGLAPVLLAVAILVLAAIVRRRA